MFKSGAMAAGLMLILGGLTTLISPLCVPCLALLVGVGAGYLAGVFDRPLDSGGATKAGAVAGAVGGAGAWLAHVCGGLINAVVIGPERSAEIMRQFGLTVDASNPAAYYIGAFGGACCMGLFEVALMVGLGAVGGILWYQLTGKNSTPTPAF